MGPPIPIGNNCTPGPSVIIEDIHNMGPWSAGPSDTEFVTEGAQMLLILMGNRTHWSVPSQNVEPMVRRQLKVLSVL
jgi:hypothetical protein